jgi:hypothetical protein
MSASVPLDEAALALEERQHQLTTKEGWQERVLAGRRQAPAQLSHDEFAALAQPLKRRYDEARKVWHANLGPILTPQMASISDELEELVDSNRQDAGKVKPSAVLDAWPGLGKTTLVTSFAAELYRNDIELRGPVTADGHERIPVAYISLTSSTTMRTLNSMLCNFYGHPGAHTGNAQRLADRATRCIRDCGTRLVVIDDVHFLDLNRRNDREVANHFKWLATQFPVTFIFVGVGIQERGLLNEGKAASGVVTSQTARRWTLLTLEPFEVRTAAGRSTWRDLLLTIERDLRLTKKWPGMIADDLAAYLYARSTGHFASLMSLITRGCRRAVTTGEEALTQDLLDGVRADSAAESGRSTLEQAFEAGNLRVLKRTKR